MKLKAMKMCEGAKGQWAWGSGGIKRMNKGDGREWKGMKMCEGVEGNRRVDVRGGKGG
jgi:hypothetical protein